MSTAEVARRLNRLEVEPQIVAVPDVVEELTTPAEVLAVVSQTISDVRTGRLDARDGAVIGGLASVALKAIEVGELAAQVEALTSVLEPERRRRLPGRKR